MPMQLTGRQTQFYIDILYGLLFAAGFAVLLFGGLDSRIVAFQGGLVPGYFLHVWENMSVYERILQEEVAAEVEKQVTQEVVDTLRERLTEDLASQIDDQLRRQLLETLNEKERGT